MPAGIPPEFFLLKNDRIQMAACTPATQTLSSNVLL